MDQINTDHVSSKSNRQSSEADRRFAFVQSCWHRSIVDHGRDAFLAEMAQQGIAKADIEVFEVPGAFEIPLLAKQLAGSGRYKAVVACGFVVDGGIYRHEFVADAVISALMSVQLEAHVPVISAVLTPIRFHEHEEHQSFFAQNFVVKGTEAASACLSMVKAMDQVHALHA